MAQKQIPGFLKKRSLLWETKNRDTLKKYGDEYFSNGHFDDALEFYLRAESLDDLPRILDVAKKDGDIVLCRKILRFKKEDMSKEILNEIGRNARELGKLAVAKQAYMEAENEVMLREIEALTEKELPKEMEGNMGEEEE